MQLTKQSVNLWPNITTIENMEMTKEEAIKKFKLLLKHKKEMEEGAKKYYGIRHRVCHLIF